MTIIFKENKPFIEGVSLNDIISTQATPFYIYSQEVITDSFNKLKEALKSEIFPEAHVKAVCCPVTFLYFLILSIYLYPSRAPSLTSNFKVSGLLFSFASMNIIDLYDRSCRFFD